MNFLKKIPWGFYGIWVLPLGSLMGIAVHGTITYGWPVLFPVIVKEFGWSAAVAATASSMARFEGGFEAPIAGWIMDKYGPRITLYFGGLLLGLGWIALSFVTAENLLFYFIVFGFIVQTGSNVGGYSSSYKAVNNWWVKWRARGIGIMVFPVGAAGTFSPMILAALIQGMGWRTTLQIMGAFVLAIYIPCAYFIRPHLPEHYGLLPDGDDPKKVKVDATAEEKRIAEQALLQESQKKQTDFSISGALKTKSFWIYTIASIFYYFAFISVTLFVPAHMVSRGYDLATAAFFAGIMVSITYIGRLTIIFFGDIISPKWLSVFSWVFSAAGIFCMGFVSVDAPYLAWGYAIFYGIGYGIAVPIGAIMTGWLFGRTFYATIRGLITTVTMVGSVTAPTFLGWTFDTYGTYYWGYISMGVSMLIASLILCFATRPEVKKVSSPVTATNVA